MRDARVAFDFAWNGQRFAPCSPPGVGSASSQPSPQAPDLTISASAHDFMLLAQRKQDPGHPVLQPPPVHGGDTELGLVVKNALDALELPVLDPPSGHPAPCSPACCPSPEEPP